MLGVRDTQSDLFRADHLHLEYVGRDTFNLLADGIAKVLRSLLACLQVDAESSATLAELAQEFDLSRYVGEPSLKASRNLDWDDVSQRNEFLAELAADVQRAVRMGREILAGLPKPSALPNKKAREKSEKTRNAAHEALALLEQLLSQDVVEGEDGNPRIKRGVAKDRIPAAHDPEVRHGRKSKRRRFDGHKGEIVVDTESGVILDASLKPGNATDAQGSLRSVERSEATLEAACRGQGASSDPGVSRGLSLTRAS